MAHTPDICYKRTKTVSQAPSLYSEIGLGEGNLPKLLAACNGTEYLMAAFIPIFIIEKAGRRPLMLFGVRSPFPVCHL